MTPKTYATKFTEFVFLFSFGCPQVATQALSKTHDIDITILICKKSKSSPLRDGPLVPKIQALPYLVIYGHLAIRSYATDIGK